MNTVVIVLAIVFAVFQAISVILGKIGHREYYGNGEDYWENEVCEYLNEVVCIPVSGICIVGFIVTLIISYII